MRLLEAILEPDLPIVDPHHHLWSHSSAYLEEMARSPFEAVVERTPRYMVDDLLADLRSGHNIRSTVYIENNLMYRAAGPDALKAVGEVEYVNGVAAMAASGDFGQTRFCAGIVGSADLSRGAAVQETLEALIHAGDGRFRGIRPHTAFSADPAIFGGVHFNTAGLLADPTFRQGFACLHRLGLSADMWAVEPQLPEITALARAFPETQIILDHTGSPLGIGSYRGRREERFPIWRASMKDLAGCANIVVKLGGLGMPYGGFESFGANPPATSGALAAEWEPYIHTAIELFGVERCMFESNYPADAVTCSYRVLWNTFKRMTASASADDKAALFSRTASRIYRVET